MLGLDKKRRLFFRNIGRTSEGKVPKFFLGGDEREAIIRNASLEQVWAIVKGDGYGGRWNLNTHAIAKAVASGSGSVVLSPPGFYARGKNLARWLEWHRERFGRFVRIDAPDPAAEEHAFGECVQLREEAMEQVEREFPVFDRVVAAPKLAAVLSLYQKEIDERAAHSDASGSLCAQSRNLEALIRLVGDVRISSRNDLQSVADALANPSLHSKFKRPLARITRRKLWGQLMRTLRTAEDDGRINLPRGADRIRLVLPRQAEGLEIRMWSLSQLRTLYAVASPLVRSFMLLGLNCAFQAADFGDLADAHLHLGKTPPVRNLDSGDWLVMSRKKTGVPGVHRLWQETRDALRWLIARRNRIVKATSIPTTNLFISEQGKNLTAWTSGGNKSYRIGNLWRNCVRTAQRQNPEVLDLPVKFLRKASQDYMRTFASDEIVSIHARRGQITSDTLMRYYASRPWRRVAEATDDLRRILGEALDQQPPFPTLITLETTMAKRGRPPKERAG